MLFPEKFIFDFFAIAYRLHRVLCVLRSANHFGILLIEHRAAD